MSWVNVAVGVTTTMIGSFMSSDSNEISYTPNPVWQSMQEDIMGQVRSGLEAGGYTWDDATNETLKRMALESVSSSYSGGAQAITSALTPYGNIGAAGRGLTDYYTSKAKDEWTAKSNIDVSRETQKLSSYQNLLGLGAGMQDPNKSQLAVSQYNAQQPTDTARFGDALSTGIGTGMNLSQTQKNNDWWQNYLSSIGGGSSGSGSTSSFTPGSLTNMVKELSYSPS